MNRRNFKKRDDSNAELVNLGKLSHKCGSLFVLNLATTDIPFPNAFVFDKNKKQIGKVEEVLGPQNDVYVAVTADKDSQEFYIYSNKLIPKNRFLERTETEKKKEAEDKKRKRMEGDKKFGRGGDNKFSRGGDRKGGDNKFSRGGDRKGGDNKFSRGGDRKGGDRKFGGEKRKFGGRR